MCLLYHSTTSSVNTTHRDSSSSEGVSAGSPIGLALVYSQTLAGRALLLCGAAREGGFRNAGMEKQVELLDVQIQALETNLKQLDS